MKKNVCMQAFFFVSVVSTWSEMNGAILNSKNGAGRKLEPVIFHGRALRKLEFS